MSKTLGGLVYFASYLYGGRSPPYNYNTKYTSPHRVFDRREFGFGFGFDFDFYFGFEMFCALQILKFVGYGIKICSVCTLQLEKVCVK